MLEVLINFFGQKIILSLITLFTLVSTQTVISPDLSSTFRGNLFKIDFSQFSPAFAAFEDDYLYADEGLVATTLAAGQSVFHPESVEKKVEKETLVSTSVVQEQPSPFQIRPKLLDSFDGDSSLSMAKKYLKQERTKKALGAFKLATNDKVENSEELRFGSLAAMVNKDVPHETPESGIRSVAPHKNSKKAAAKKDGSLDAKSDDEDEVSTPLEAFKISGHIALKEGLAFIGSMQVSWVVGDYELQVGSINTPDATYEIEVSKLVGDIIISLYDSKDELIGEGVLDLTVLSTKKENHQQDIEIHPIDWDIAGEVLDAHYLGGDAPKRLKDVEVALYAFNEATKTNGKGEFQYHNWKKTNSRTLAIASKEGYRDSIFTLDSKIKAKALLFKESYMEAFFSYLDDLGIYSVQDKGTVYGQIRGVQNVSGYRLHLEQNQPIYFLPVGFAGVDLKQTTSNGLFSFVGLQDGDYELLVEKDGEIVDTRIIVVEQGKVSPILVDLSNVSKHIEFFDPLMPERKIDNVEVSFFDGSSNQSLDNENQVKQKLSRGQDLSLMEYSNSQDISRTLLSRNKGLQKVPLINDQKLLDLVKAQGYAINNGLVFGFVESSEPYWVSIAESPAEKTVYFDDKGQVVEQGDPNVRGFIMAGFPEGLSSLVIESIESKSILGTDLIYSDHQSISVTHLEIFPQ